MNEKGKRRKEKDREGERKVFWMIESKDDVEGGQQEKRKYEREAVQGSWSDEVDGEREKKEEMSGKGESKVVEEGVQVVEKVEKVENVMDEDEGMVKTQQNPLDFRQSEVRDELTDETILEIPRKIVRQSRWMSVVNEKTIGNLEDIEETWIEVKRRTRTQEPRQSEEVRKNRQMIQIIIRVARSKAFPRMVSPSDKVDDVIRRILNNEKSSKGDVYMTCQGRVLRWSDELRSSGVGDECTVQMMNMMSGGGKHRNKKNRAEKKTTASPKNQESVRGNQEHDEENIIHNSEPEQGQQEPKKDKRVLSREYAEDEVIRHFEETEGTRMIFTDLAKGN